MSEKRLGLLAIGSLTILLLVISSALFIQPRFPELFFQIFLPVAAGASVICFLILKNLNGDYTAVIFASLSLLTVGTAILYFAVPELPEVAFQTMIPAAAFCAIMWFLTSLFSHKTPQ
jgi:hypothetical protein